MQVNPKGFRPCTQGPHRSASGAGLPWHQDSARGDSRLLPRSGYWGVLSATERRTHPLRVLRRLRGKPTEEPGSGWRSAPGRAAPPPGRERGLSSGSGRLAGVLESQSGLRPTTLVA